MRLEFNAILGKQGGRKYYSAVVPFTAVPHLFTFQDSNLAPEERYQRLLKKARIGPISRYLRDNADGFVLPSLTASFEGEASFFPVGEDDGEDDTDAARIGRLAMELGDTKFIIQDGQHRVAGISDALRFMEEIGENDIMVQFFRYESKERAQQMFADLNRFSVKTPATTNIMMDHRDETATATKESFKLVPIFASLVDREHVSVSAKSTNLFTLVHLYEANKELLQPSIDQLPGGIKRPVGEPLLYQDKLAIIVETWQYLTDLLGWNDVLSGKVAPADFREKYITAHGVILRAVASISGNLRISEPENWRKKLAPLTKVIWAKYVEQKNPKSGNPESVINPDWNNVVIVSGSVGSSRQIKDKAKEYLRRKLGLSEKAVGIEVAETEPPTKTAKPAKAPKVMTASSSGNAASAVHKPSRARAA